jgi:hypothetical protein
MREPGSLAACANASLFELHQIGNQQEQPAHPCSEFARGQDEVIDIGDRLDLRTDAGGTFLVEPAR